MKRSLRGLFSSVLILVAANGFSQSSALVSYGQQDPQFTQYMFNPVYFNPAASGVEDAFISTLNVRNQWVNLPGAPISQTFTSHVPVFKLSSGIGAMLMNDIAGYQRNTGAALIYSYHKQFRTSLLSFGLSGGIMQQTINGDKLITPTGTYENTVNHNDPNLPVTTSSQLLPDAAAGIYFFGPHLSAGVSGTHLLTPILQGKENTVSAIQYNPNGYVYVAYQIDVSDKLGVTPNVLYKTDLSESMVDVNVFATYNDNICVGLSYRGFTNNQHDAVAILAGLNITDKWRISYSYDITTSAINAVSAGSHEVVLRYSIPVARPRAGKMINNPRFLYH